jgi:hypothetical protein
MTRGPWQTDPAAAPGGGATLQSLPIFGDGPLPRSAPDAGPRARGWPGPWASACRSQSTRGRYQIDARFWSSALETPRTLRLRRRATEQTPPKYSERGLAEQDGEDGPHWQSASPHRQAEAAAPDPFDTVGQPASRGVLATDRPAHRYGPCPPTPASLRAHRDARFVPEVAHHRVSASQLRPSHHITHE